MIASLSAASLMIGPHGQVWASGRLAIRDGTSRAVVRFDGQTWQQMGGPVPLVPRQEIIANVGEDLVYVMGNGVYRSDGTEWQTLAWDNTGWGAVRSLAVTEAGHVWLQRVGGVARWEASSGWEAVGPASAGWDDLTIQALAADGNEVFVAGSRGLFRVDGGELTPVWAPARVGPPTDLHPPVDEAVTRDAPPGAVRRLPHGGVLGRGVAEVQVIVVPLPPRPLGVQGAPGPRLGLPTLDASP